MSFFSQNYLLSPLSAVGCVMMTAAEALEPEGEVKCDLCMELRL